MRNQNDALWKGLLDDLTGDFLRFIIPEVETVIDPEQKFTYLDKELSDFEPSAKIPVETLFVDKLVRATAVAGEKEWVLIHIEVQGKPENRALFPDRMFNYYNRIFAKYRIPVVAIAIFTGNDGDKIPNVYQNEFLGTENIFRYNAYSICDASEDELIKSNNPFAIVILAVKRVIQSRKIDDEELILQELEVVKMLIEKHGVTSEKSQKIIEFIRKFIVFDDPKMNGIFTSHIVEITGKTETMGIIEQIVDQEADIRAEILANERAEKMAKERAEKMAKERADILIKESEERKNEFFVISLLQGTEFSDEKIASLTQVSISTVEQIKWRQKAKDATTLDGE